MNSLLGTQTQGKQHSEQEMPCLPRPCQWLKVATYLLLANEIPRPLCSSHLLLAYTAVDLPWLHYGAQSLVNPTFPPSGSEMEANPELILLP